MMPQQGLLLEKAKKSLEAAKLLANEGLYEISISQSYYTMFHLARLLLLDKGLTFSKHGSLLGAFGLHFVKSGEIEQKYHRYLLDSHDLRIMSDYDAESLLSKVQAEEQIAHAEEFLAMTETLLKI